MTITSSTATPDWPAEVHSVLRDAGVHLVSYVPDAGHKRLIELCQEDPSIRTIPLTTEEEAVGLALGAWLGRERSVLLLQSSGVGNMVNALGTVRECRLPFVMIAAMRGEEGELNPWQVPVGQATPTVLEAMGVRVRRAGEPGELAPTVRAALEEAYDVDAAVAVLISQSLIGIKPFEEGRNG